MSLFNRLFLAGFGSFALLGASAVAGENAPATPNQPPEKGTKPAVAAESIAQLIEQLDSAKFKDRQKATEKLAVKGKEAIPALEKAAATGNLEVSSRATTLLGGMLKSTDQATAQAAEKSLQKLAGGESPSASRKAKSILEEKNGPKQNDQDVFGPGGGIVIPGGVIPGGGFGGRIIINGGQLNIGGGPGMRSVSVSNVNGVKEIEVSEDGRKIKIQDDPANGIKIESTEKENGKETTKKYEAKNADDLKKNQPAGYEIYKKYVGEQQGNAVQFNIQGGILGGGNFQFPGNPMPAIPRPALPIRPLAPLQGFPGAQGFPGTVVPQESNSQLDMTARAVRSLSSRLERLRNSDAYRNASPESKAELKKQIEDLSKQLENARSQLGDK
jgi:hypothetical protein